MGSEKEEDVIENESEENEESTHEKLSSAGKKGAATRWARAKKQVSSFPFRYCCKHLCQVIHFLQESEEENGNGEQESTKTTTKRGKKGSESASTKKPRVSPRLAMEHW